MPGALFGASGAPFSKMAPRSSPGLRVLFHFRTGQMLDAVLDPPVIKMGVPIFLRKKDKHNQMKWGPARFKQQAVRSEQGTLA